MVWKEKKGLSSPSGQERGPEVERGWGAVLALDARGQCCAANVAAQAFRTTKPLSAKKLQGSSQGAPGTQVVKV